MFTWLNKQGVKSDKGFVLQSAHRFFYHYIEDDYVMKVYVEPGVNGIELIVLESFDKWQAPHENEIITEEKRKAIIRNVDEALTFMNIPHEFGHD